MKKVTRNKLYREGGRAEELQRCFRFQFHSCIGNRARVKQTENEMISMLSTC